MVTRLEIESLVNSAQCPTRVEASVATKDQVEPMTMMVMILTLTPMKGLREGYKWLVKVDTSARLICLSLSWQVSLGARPEFCL